MDKAFLYIVLLTLNSIELEAQGNLVPNPSFEEFYHCPDELADFSAVKEWTNPSMGTPDYYHICNTTTAGIPNNIYGNQYPRSGNAYSGIVTFSVDGLYREYIQIRLIQELESDVTYKICFYSSLADQCVYGSNSLGISFMKQQVDSVNLTGNIPATSFLSHTQLVSEFEQWEKIEFIYIAQGQERYLIIGNFNTDSNTHYQQVNALGQQNHEAYYFIDDVSIEKFDFVVPNIFTPNNDGVNDIFLVPIPIGISTTIEIFNRWGSIVYANTNTGNIYWDGVNSYTQIKSTEGTYFYVITINSEATRITKKGFVQLVR